MSLIKSQIAATSLVLILALTAALGEQQPVATEEIPTNSNSTNTTEPELPIPERPDLWCPLNYDLLYLPSVRVWFQLCKPSSCLPKAVLPPKHLFVAIDNQTTLDEVGNLCPADGMFQVAMNSTSCRRVRLSPSQFRLNLTDGSLTETQKEVKGRRYELGHYLYLEETKEAVVCRNEPLPNDDTDDVPFSCFPYQPNSTEEYMSFPNGSVFFEVIGRVVRPGFYSLKPGSDEVDTACFSMNPVIEGCINKLPLFEDSIVEMHPDLTLSTDYFGAIDYPLGAYFIDPNHTLAVSCIDAGESQRQETKIFYSVAFCLSLIFSFLTILVHLLYPSLNYHAKALLCHIISLFIMYLCMVIRNFYTDWTNDVGRLIFFGVHYVSGLSAFFWLNVLAYELWRVFSNLHGGTGSLGPQKPKKRWFIMKCLYAWGIPLLLCGLTIGLAYHPRAARLLDISLATPLMIWFTSDKSIFTLFYLPVLIILVENVVFFVLTVFNIRQASSGTQILNKKVSKQLLRVFVKIFIVMGIFWFFEVISWVLQSRFDQAAWYFTDFINGMQGVVIFIIYVCKRSTWKILKKKWKGEKTGTEHHGNSKSTSSSAITKGRKISESTGITMANVTNVTITRQ